MTITGAIVYALSIPFQTPFSHHLSSRRHSDSIVVRVDSDAGVSGYGEGLPRPYVTGETREAAVEYIRRTLIPRITGTALEAIATRDIIDGVGNLMPETDAVNGVVWNAARCAVELAVLDCLLRARGLSLGQALPPVVTDVTYSAVIGGGSIMQAEVMARRCREAGFRQVKMKVSSLEDVARVAAVRMILGDEVSLRLDANAAFDPATAATFADAVSPYDIAALEQPIPRGTPAGMAALRARMGIPLMVDESLVTCRDAEALIAAGAADLFNLRLSKCGGFRGTLAIARLAHAAGIGLQLGCQVGETAILSAAGRHLAAHLPNLHFVEGSYGTHLLKEDVAEPSLCFGAGGSAPLLNGPGLGITVRPESLATFADASHAC